MFGDMQQAIGQVAADFVEVRREIDRHLAISVTNRAVKEVSDSVTGAYFSRALIDGGLASYCFPLDADLTVELSRAARLAALASRARTQKTRLSPAPPASDEVRLYPRLHPRDVPLDEKVALLLRYASVASRHPRIVQCELAYTELEKRKWLVSTDGMRLFQEQLICFITGRVVAKDGAKLEDVRVGVGGTEDFTQLLDRDDAFDHKAGIAVDLLRAPKVTPGVRTALLNPMMAGLFIHESFGHFSEADLVVNNPQLITRMRLGEPIASESLNVVDDGSLHGAPGWWVYDDEGVRTGPTRLIRDGVLVGRMHSRETAARLAEPLSGNAVAQSCRHAPVVRMTNIYVMPGWSCFTDLLEAVDDGLYVCDAKGGQTMGDLYSFGAQYGYEIKHGRIGRMVSGINMSGNLFTTLKSIRGVGDDLAFREVGGCGKAGQINFKSGLGGPHLLIDGVTIG
ncbi:MAG: TldD/PmbA family protein [Myxococcales bacterium]|nr:MAG: TldD/PmbA family protein [Myxococcales bacterium]